MIEGLPLVQFGQGGLLLLIVLMVITDRLVWHKRLDALASELKAEREKNAALTAQVDLLLKSAVPTFNSLAKALQEAADLPSRDAL